jgi:hypothetical protein
MKVANGLAVGLVALIAAACSSWKPPAPPPETAVVPPGPDNAFTLLKGKAKKPLTVAERFARVRDRIFDRWLEDDPSFGRGLGFHRYDGRVAAYAAAALKARYERVDKERGELAAFDKEKLSPDDALDLAIMENQADQVLFAAYETTEW